MKIEEIKKATAHAMFKEEITCNSDMVDILSDLIDRAITKIEDDTDCDRYEAIWEAIDEGLIYTEDRWKAYKNYCEMGDPVDIMDERIYSDICHIVNQLMPE